MCYIHTYDGMTNYEVTDDHCRCMGRICRTKRMSIQAMRSAQAKIPIERIVYVSELSNRLLSIASVPAQIMFLDDITRQVLTSFDSTTRKLHPGSSQRNQHGIRCFYRAPLTRILEEKDHGKDVGPNAPTVITDPKFLGACLEQPQ